MGWSCVVLRLCFLWWWVELGVRFLVAAAAAAFLAAADSMRSLDFLGVIVCAGGWFGLLVVRWAEGKEVLVDEREWGMLAIIVDKETGEGSIERIKTAAEEYNRGTSSVNVLEMLGFYSSVQCNNAMAMRGSVRTRRAILSSLCRRARYVSAPHGRCHRLFLLLDLWRRLDRLLCCFGPLRGPLGLAADQV